jgi:hypothetical protein
MVVMSASRVILGSSCAVSTSKMLFFWARPTPDNPAKNQTNRKNIRKWQFAFIFTEDYSE